MGQILGGFFGIFFVVFYWLEIFDCCEVLSDFEGGRDWEGDLKILHKVGSPYFQKQSVSYGYEVHKIRSKIYLKILSSLKFEDQTKIHDQMDLFTASNKKNILTAHYRHLT